MHITDKLFYTSQYTRDFVAELLQIDEINGQCHVVLDKTAFFPGGGGQWYDTGTIESSKVLDVYEKEQIVYHVLDRKPNKIHKLKCSIDWKRREDGMHQHLAQHVLSGCFFKKLNQNTVAIHLGQEISTVDIAGILSEEDIAMVEKYANEIIEDSLDVNFLTPSKKELKKMWLRRDLPNTDEEIRVVEIEDLDRNACCGVHPNNTRELRMIKIKKFEKHKDSTRVEFLSGKRAVDYVLNREQSLTKICNFLSCNDVDALNGISNLNEKLATANSKTRKLEEIVAEYEVKEIISKAMQIGNIEVCIVEFDESEMKDAKYITKLSNKLTDKGSRVALLAAKSADKSNFVFASSDDLKSTLNMGALLKDALTLVDGKGGGSTTFAQGGGKNNGNVKATLDYTSDKILKTISI
ncbi:MAG: alanyl-tRNA editing protein AlaX-L [Clostridioides sp.]|jgi:alanyl-tRNA synthetase|nr:alanyl-tRNA editing protein AlaX-L [Clostridioides sp.]